jgi:hypothetical protein
MRGGTAVLVPNPIPTREGYRALLTDAAGELARLGRHDYYYQRGPRYYWTDASRTLRLARLTAHVALRAADPGRTETGGRFNPDSEAFQVLTSVFRRFREAAERNGSRPIVLILPDSGDVQRLRTSGVKRYDPLIAYFDAHGIEYTDLMPAFERHGLDRADALFRGHYTALGNHVVARYLRESLAARGLVRRADAGTTSPAGQ